MPFELEELRFGWSQLREKNIYLSGNVAMSTNSRRGSCMYVRRSYEYTKSHRKFIVP